MMRFVAVFVAVGVSIASTGVARAAETGMLPNGAKITWSKFKIAGSKGELKEPDPEERQAFLNLAHCMCAKAKPTESFSTFQYEFALSPAVSTGMGGTGEFWVGTQCDSDNSQTRDTNCRRLSQSISDIDTLTTPATRTFNLYDVINGKDNMGVCVQQEGSKFLWLLVDNNGGQPYEYTTSQGVGEITGDTIKVDTKPPEKVVDLDAAGSEGAIELTWTLNQSNTKDYAYFQALCAKAKDDSAVFTGDDVPSPRYQTAGALCGEAGGFSFEAAEIDAPDEDNVSSVPFGALEETFLCGEALSGGAQSLRISGLTNGEKYKVALLAIDLHGNVTGAFLNKTVTPTPVIDFWEDLQSRNGAVDGGCLLSTTYGDGNPLTRTLREFRDDTLARSAAGRWLASAYYATLGQLHVQSLAARIAAGIALLPLVALALLWHLLGLPLTIALLAALIWLWRRRAALLASRRLRVAAAAAAAAAALGLAPGLAAADDFTPYWEDPSQTQSSLEGTREVRWNAGIRLGPYTPDIDLQFSQNAITEKGPYEAMFGDYYIGGKKHEQRVWQVLPMLDVDRIVWSRFGQIGVGGTIGYMQKSAYAYADGTDENTLMRERSTGGKTTFRLIPLAATVTYRLTYADDRWGIPVIPYLRAGLAYYMWWMKGPSGTSKVCEGGTDDGEMCTDDKAYGGTPGVQVSAGLAVRAERIDTAAARSMRNSGLQHAGFYGEVFWGRVDGFGSETKLWVGDTTWFAGVNFEF
jgi:hypothetical protein